MGLDGVEFKVGLIMYMVEEEEDEVSVEMLVVYVEANKDELELLGSKYLVEEVDVEIF